MNTDISLKIRLYHIFTVKSKFKSIMTCICVYLRSSAVNVEMIIIPAPPDAQGKRMYSAVVVHVASVRRVENEGVLRRVSG